MQLSKNAKIVSVITPTAGAAGTTDIEGTVVDTQGFRGCLFIIQVGALTTGAVTSAKVQQGAASDVSDAADLAGTSVSIPVADAGKVKYIDVLKPGERYLRLLVDRGTANAVISSAVAVLYDPVDAPTTHGANVAGESHVSPAEGTA